MGRNRKVKRQVVEPEVIIANLTARPWPNRTNPYSVNILTASDTLLVSRVSPGVPQNEGDFSKGYGVFYMGKQSVEKDTIIYECNVKGVYSNDLIPLVQKEATTYVRCQLRLYVFS